MAKWIAAWLAAFAVAAVLALAFAPYLYAELGIFGGPRGWTLAPPPVGDFNARTGPKAGEIVEGYWRVQDLGHDTWAIGEPADDPDNYEYLIVGATRALLIDAGAHSRDIRPAIARLTRLPLTVIPTHLHYDHTNGLRWLTTDSRNTVALIDLPQTRERVKDGLVRLGRYQYLGANAGSPPVFQVGQWVKPDGVIDLGGGRVVRVLWTPGHTVSSISIHDPAAGRLFTGDLIYPTTLYEFQPDSSLSAFVATADRLLRDLPPDTVLYGAHCCRNDRPAEAPWLTLDDLRDTRREAQAIRDGQAHGRGFIIRRFPVNGRMTMLTLYPFGNR